MIVALLQRDLRLAMRGGAASLLPPLFFLLAASLFPLGIGPEAGILGRIGSGVILVVALLAALLSLERLFAADAEDGALDLLAAAPVPLETVFLGKVLSHWVLTGAPLILTAPLLGGLYHLPAGALPALVLAMLLTTPLLSLIGAVGAALIVGARHGGVLLALLVLPLYIPALIFAAGAVDAVIVGGPARAGFVLLGALLPGAAVLCPWAGTAALRQALG